MKIVTIMNCGGGGYAKDDSVLICPQTLMPKTMMIETNTMQHCEQTTYH